MPGFLVAAIVALHVVVCIALMASILLQSGKGGGLAGAFGAGSSQTLFGGRGAATFLSRATTTLAVVFFVTSLTLGLHASRSGGARQRSLIQEEAQKRNDQRGSAGAPALPASGAPGTQGGTPAAPQGPIPGALVPGTPATSPSQPSTAPPAGGSTAPSEAQKSASPATGATK